VAVAECRFLLETIDDNEVRDEDGYDLFEPELSFYIGEANVFEAVYGKPKVKNVVIMHAREEWLKQTVALTRHVDEGLPNTEYWYDFLGTRFSLVALRRGDNLDLHTATEFRAVRTPGPVGRITVRGWIGAIVDVSRQLSDLFRRLRPQLLRDSLFQRQELTLQEIESWLIAGSRYR
jgi:hypothetical protein